MTADRRQYGQDGETLAVRHLELNGYTILQRNFRTARGEIDIVARHKGMLVFVEVKTRRSLRFGDPKWALTPAKQKKISMVALEYLKKKHGTTAVKARFDVVTIQQIAHQPCIEVFANAFELAFGG